MSKKLVIAMLLAIIVFGVIFAKLMVSDDVYVEKMTTEENFKKNIQKAMLLIPLDYMDSKEIGLCNGIKEILRKNANNMEIVFPRIVDNIDSLYNDVPSKCKKEEFEEIFSTEEDGYQYSYYQLDNEEILIFINSSNLLNHITALAKDKCAVDENVVRKSLIVSENTMLVKIDSGYYIISEWFSSEKYVFYSLDKSHDYDGVICRFNVDNNV